MTENNVFLIILNYKSYYDTIKYIDQLKNQKKIKLNIIVVDNCSPNNSYSILKKKYSKVNDVEVIISEKNGGYAYGNNFGLKFIEDREFDFVIVSNNDIIIDDEYLIYKLCEVYNKLDLPSLISPVMKQDSVVSENFAWKIPNLIDDVFGSLRISDFFYKKNRYYKFSQDTDYIQVDCIPGSFFMSRKPVLYSLGLLDENTFLYMEEAILAIKNKKKGLKNYIISNLSYEHEVSGTISKSMSNIKIRKNLINSRLYFHKNYLKTGVFGILLLKFLFILWVLEYYVYNIYKKK